MSIEGFDKDLNNLVVHCRSEKSAYLIVNVLNNKIKEIGFASVYDLYDACNWIVGNRYEEYLKEYGWGSFIPANIIREPFSVYKPIWWTIKFPPARNIFTYSGISKREETNKMGEDWNCVIKNWLSHDKNLKNWLGYEENHNNSITNEKNITKKESEDRKMKKSLCVKDVITHNNKVVIVKFSDGTFTKSICSDNDTFDIDVGISICCLKRLMCTDDNVENANKLYNNFMRKVHRQMAQKVKDKVKALNEKKERRETQAARKAKNDMKRQENRNEFICDVSKAIKLASEEINSKIAFQKEEK